MFAMVCGLSYVSSSNRQIGATKSVTVGRKGGKANGVMAGECVVTIGIFLIKKGGVNLCLSKNVDCE